MADEITQGYESSDAADNAYLKFDAELREAIKAQGIVDVEVNNVRRKIINLELEKLELTGKARKARENIRRIESEMRTAKTWFFKLKNDEM